MLFPTINLTDEYQEIDFEDRNLSNKKLLKKLERHEGPADTKIECM